MRGIVKMEEGGYILTNESCENVREGYFAAGIAEKNSWRQVATAVGRGNGCLCGLKNILKTENRGVGQIAKG